MARQVLENGVILPAEYSDDWYDDMTSNLTKLDDVIGSDSEKLSSADVGAAALSNNYNDLDNLPTIPTVNDATLTIQKNGEDVQTFTANASSNVTANITVPTKTSDLTNDSDFVDTSNSAVSSGITSAKVTDYDDHIADTDIHVTTADKNRWNNQTYVFRYSSTVLVASSTNSNTLLDNTDNLKVGDKVIDSSGVLFSITAIDSQNSTFTIGTALIYLAQDSNVVHKSGDESVIGSKRFGVVQNFTGYPSIRLYSTNDDISVLPSYTQQQDIRYTDKNNNIIAYFVFQHRSNANEPFRTCWRQIRLDGTDSYYSVDFNNLGEFYPENNNAINLGRNGNRWKSVYSTEYYYGSNNVEFSTKFVTTDTAQTITGNKTFSEDVVINNSDASQISKRLVIRSSKVGLGDNNSDSWGISFNAGASYASLINSEKSTSSIQGLNFTVRTRDADNNLISASYRIRVYTNGLAYLSPTVTDYISLGSSSEKWKDTCTNLINGLEPSSLSLPSGNASDFIDISSYFTNTGSGDTNSYTASANGWIYLRLGDLSGCDATVFDANNNQMWGQTVTGKVEQMTIPILKGQTLTTQWNTSSTVNVATARFIPCQGNV